MSKRPGREPVSNLVEIIEIELHEGCGCDDPRNPQKCILIEELAALDELAARAVEAGP